MAVPKEALALRRRCPRLTRATSSTRKEEDEQA